MNQDRSRRYETVNVLALDLARFLVSEPVLARPPSALYRFGKFVARNRAACIFSLVILLTVLAGFAVSTADSGTFGYSVAGHGTPLISHSALGLDFGLAAKLLQAVGKSRPPQTRSVDSTWKPLWGKRAVVPDRYRETSIELSGSGAPFDRITLTARAYDDGVAFRYSIPKDAKGNASKATRDLTEYNFAADFTAWFYHGEDHNLGPDKLSTINGNREPVMTLQAAENSFLALHEADLRQGEPLRLEKSGPTSFRALTSPGEIAPGYAGPWRAIFFGTSSSPHRKCRGAKAKRSPV